MRSFIATDGFSIAVYLASISVAFSGFLSKANAEDSSNDSRVVGCFVIDGTVYSVRTDREKLTLSNRSAAGDKPAEVIDTGLKTKQIQVMEALGARWLDHGIVIAYSTRSDINGRCRYHWAILQDGKWTRNSLKLQCDGEKARLHIVNVRNVKSEGDTLQIDFRRYESELGEAITEVILYLNRCPTGTVEHATYLQFSRVHEISPAAIP